MTESTEAQGRLHPALVGTEARRVIEIAKAHGALGWKVNGAGGEGGSLTLLCDESSSRKRALVREIEQDSPALPEHPDLPQPARPARLAPGPRARPRAPGRLGYPWPMRSVGRSVPRKEGLDKARGTARYVDDLRFPGMLHGRTIRATIPAGELAGRPPRLRHARASPSSTTATSRAATSSRSSRTTSPTSSSARCATPRSRSSSWPTRTARRCARPTVRLEYRPADARPRPRAIDAGLQGDHDREGRPRPRLRRGRPRGRGRVPHRPPGARLHRAERRHRRARRRTA